MRRRERLSQMEQKWHYRVRTTVWRACEEGGLDPPTTRRGSTNNAYDTVAASLELAAELVRETRFRKESIAARLEDGFLDATTLMEYLIAQGVPMRSAHEAVGKLVRTCNERRCRLADLPAEVYEGVRPGLAEGVYQVLGVANALNAFRSVGSTAPAEVAKQLELWRTRLTSAAEG